MNLTVIDLRQECWEVTVEARPYPQAELKELLCGKLRYHTEEVAIHHEGHVWDVYTLVSGDEVVVAEVEPAVALKELGITPTKENLTKAINRGDVRMVRLLTGAGAGAPHTGKKAPTWSPLHLACRLGHAAVITTLLDLGLDVNEANAYGATPLHTTTKHSAPGKITQVLDVLVGRGAAVHSRDALKRTPLYYASQRGCLHAVNFLKQCGATV